MGSIDFPPLLLDVVEEHASEAAFLWSLRDGAVRSPACDLGSLGRLDERLEAHLDGLRIAGEEGLALCEEQLDARDAGAFFAAMVLAAERADMAAVARILARGARSAPLSRGIVSALGWIPLTRAARILPELWSSACPGELRYLGIAAAAAHRRDPGAPLLEAIASDDTRLKARALRAAGELGLSSALPLLRRELEAARGRGCDEDGHRSPRYVPVPIPERRSAPESERERERPSPSPPVGVPAPAFSFEGVGEAALGLLEMAGGAVLFGASTVGSAGLVLDDVTGVGVLDDPALVVTGAGMAAGGGMVLDGQRRWSSGIGKIFGW
ncbi:hypothetical protein sce4147 [Sorangium cellulosum So ce56]|uniref:HEAT repeat domain-containing protein n=1 Tax=Sorangium cellulosum (strain So ce56) TaxID=448385 RepID=A9EWD6_SORC5|nr:hypothetical protein sce4147 [Sorangium cellulosum So ce56]